MHNTFDGLPLHNNSFICKKCAKKYCRNEKPGAEGSYTVHTGFCDVCGESSLLTQVRDYGGLNDRSTEI